MLTTRNSFSSSSKVPFILGVAVAVAGLSALIAFETLSSPDTVPVQSKGPSFTFDQALENPLDGGRQLPLKDVRPLIPYDIPMPHSEAASADILSETWISPSNHVALVFSTDVLIIMQTPDFDNAAVEFTQLIASGSVKNGRIDLVQNDLPALIMEPDTDVDGSNPGSLQFVRNGVSITVYARSLDGDSLKEIANSIS